MIENPHAHLSPAPAVWLRSPIGLGWAAVAGLGAVIATDLFAIYADFVMYDVTGDLMGDGFGAVLTERADRADRLYAVAGTVQTVALIATVVLYLCWFHRVRVNAQVFDPSGHSMKGHWAVWGWFVPVVNLWFPRRITLEIWDTSSPWGAPRPHGLVNTWWTFWIIALVSGRLAQSAGRRADTAETLHMAAGQTLFADVVDIVAAALAIAVVLRLTRMQNEKALGGPAPVAV
ncbi:DUF4328 domain-containing protein [Streptomyces sp. NPDC046909]|uniref:DUF4328 domain-containing protein n=1 Tax=Streptomyces sp. NPDC046909 TaxID=3155617 RepID=UPI0033F1068C